jgi:hypothetical protein
MMEVHMISFHHQILDFEITWKGSMYSLMTRLGITVVLKTSYVLVRLETRNMSAEDNGLVNPLPGYTIV